MTSTGAIQAEILDMLREILGERAGDVDGLDPNAPLLFALELDSLDAVDVTMELKRRYRVELSETDTSNATLASLAALVQGRRAGV